MVGKRLIGKKLNNGKRWLGSLLLEGWECVYVCVSSRKNVGTRAQKGCLKERMRFKSPIVRVGVKSKNSGRFFDGGN